MLTIETTARFRKDFKRVEKRGHEMSLLQSILRTLAAQQILPQKHHDHALTGDYAGFRECHIQPDWLLIYAIDGGHLILTASRTGSHAGLF